MEQIVQAYVESVAAGASLVQIALAYEECGALLVGQAGAEVSSSKSLTLCHLPPTHSSIVYPLVSPLAAVVNVMV